MSNANVASPAHRAAKDVARWFAHRQPDPDKRCAALFGAYRRALPAALVAIAPYAADLDQIDTDLQDADEEERLTIERDADTWYYAGCRAAESAAYDAVLMTAWEGVMP